MGLPSAGGVAVTEFGRGFAIALMLSLALFWVPLTALVLR